MISPAESLNPLTEAIQLAVAPVFLLTGVAGMLNALGMRLARVIDRARTLEDRLCQSSAESEPRYQQFLRELRSLNQRKKIISGATALMVLCAVLIGMTVVELFYSAGLQQRLQLSQWVATTFLLGCGSFIAACVLYLVEVIVASQTIEAFKKP